MAELIANSSGLWSTATNWRGFAGYNTTGQTGTDKPVTTSYYVSAGGISSVKGVVCDGALIRVRRIPGQTTGTLTVAIASNSSIQTATEVVVPIAALGADPSTYTSVTKEQYTWILVKFAANYTFSSSSAFYRVAVKASADGIFTVDCAGTAGSETLNAGIRLYSTTGVTPTTYDYVWCPTIVLSTGAYSTPVMEYNLASCQIYNGLNGFAFESGITVSSTAGAYSLTLGSEDADPNDDFNSLYYNGVRVGGLSGTARGAGPYTFGLNHVIIAAGKFIRAGTQASPLPANVSFTLKPQAGSTAGASQTYGITVKGELSLYGAARTYPKCKIQGANIPNNIALTSFTSDVATGWVAGDLISIGNEERTISSVVGTTINLTASPYSESGIHYGTDSGELAEWVLNVTRNVSLWPTPSATPPATIWMRVIGTGKFEAEWAELQQIGGTDWEGTGFFGYPGFPYSHGINMPEGTTASWKVKSCVFKNSAGYITKIGGMYAGLPNIVFQDNIIYGVQWGSPFTIGVVAGEGMGNIAITGNIVMHTAGPYNATAIGGFELDGGEPLVEANCPDVSNNFVGYGQWYYSNGSSSGFAYYNPAYYMKNPWAPAKFQNNVARRCMMGLTIEHNATPITYSNFVALHCSHGISLGPSAGDLRYMGGSGGSNNGPVYDTEHYTQWYWVVENVTFDHFTIRDPYSTSYDGPNELRLVMVNVPCKNIMFDTCTLRSQAGYANNVKVVGSHQPRCLTTNFWFKNCTILGNALGIADRNFEGSIRITGGSYTCNYGGRGLIGSYSSFRSGGVYVAPGVTGVTGPSDAFPNGVYVKRNGFITKDTTRFRTATPAERIYTNSAGDAGVADAGGESTPKRFVLPAGKTASITVYVRKAVPYTSPPAEYDGAPGYNEFIEGQLWLRYNPDLTVNGVPMAWTVNQAMGLTTVGYGTGVWEALTSSGYTIAATVDTVVETYVRAWTTGGGSYDNRWLSIDDWTITVS